jgi:adenosylcobinamide kinase/adenosylcobinamide-phosphate guanylyltransferase
MKKIIFITGSVRSGKSNFAVKFAKSSKKKVVFLATCRPLDDEMKKRVKKHRKTRPKTWKTIEEHMDIASIIKKLEKNEIILIDCLTLWISNLLLSRFSEREIFKKIKEFIMTVKEANCSIIMVSNEVGWGIVPDNKLSRLFRDIAGTLHQKIAKVCDEVYLTVAGIPIEIKNIK